jgi:hypothetical protein
MLCVITYPLCQILSHLLQIISPFLLRVNIHYSPLLSYFISSYFSVTFFIFSRPILPYHVLFCLALSHLAFSCFTSFHLPSLHFISSLLFCLISTTDISSHLVLPCPALCCLIMPCSALSCLVLSCLTWPTRLPRDDDIGLEIIKTINGAYSSAVQ